MAPSSALPTGSDLESPAEKPSSNSCARPRRTAAPRSTMRCMSHFANSVGRRATTARSGVGPLPATDGDDTSSVVSFEDVMGLARKAGVNITIALQTQPIAANAPGHRFLSASQFSLKSLAQETSPGLLPDTDHGSADRDGSIAQEPEPASIGYSPSNSRADGPIPQDRVRVVTIRDAPKARAGVWRTAGRTTRQHPALTRH